MDEKRPIKYVRALYNFDRKHTDEVIHFYFTLQNIVIKAPETEAEEEAHTRHSLLLPKG